MFYLLHSAERSQSFPTARHMLSQPSMEALCAYEPNSACIRIGVLDNDNILYDVQLYVRPKWYLSYHLQSTSASSDGRHNIKNVHHLS